MAGVGNATPTGRRPEAITDKVARRVAGRPRGAWSREHSRVNSALDTGQARVSLKELDWTLEEGATGGRVHVASWAMQPWARRAGCAAAGARAVSVFVQYVRLGARCTTHRTTHLAHLTPRRAAHRTARAPGPHPTAPGTAHADTDTPHTVRHTREHTWGQSPSEPPTHTYTSYSPQGGRAGNPHSACSVSRQRPAPRVPWRRAPARTERSRRRRTLAPHELHISRGAL